MLINSKRTNYIYSLLLVFNLKIIYCIISITDWFVLLRNKDLNGMNFNLPRPYKININYYQRYYESYN